MKTRAQLDACLDQLAAMLPPWLDKLRHEAQFWPHFGVLAQEILDEAEETDRVHVIQRIRAILAAHGQDPAGWEPSPAYR
jgi:hypothetical protein